MDNQDFNALFEGVDWANLTPEQEAYLEESLQRCEEQEADADFAAMWRGNTRPVLYDYDLGV
jgi:hypothetical protein